MYQHGKKLVLLLALAMVFTAAGLIVTYQRMIKTTQAPVSPPVSIIRQDNGWKTSFIGLNLTVDKDSLLHKKVLNSLKENSINLTEKAADYFWHFKDFSIQGYLYLKEAVKDSLDSQAARK